MGKPTGFIEIARKKQPARPVAERVRDWHEVYLPYPKDVLRQQAARCMDCGIPFCHQGCPLGNLVPDWNDLVYRDRWQSAIERLLATNNFPEFTGRLCPAPCEGACVLGLNDDPVTIKGVENAIIERAYEEGWIVPDPPSRRRTGKRVAVVGSGPAGLAAADQLNHAGHQVTVFERADRIGGLLRYGIPEFKLEKRILERRLDVMRAEGVVFKTNADIGVNVPARSLIRDFDAVVLAGGAGRPRDLPIPGRDLGGIHFAMDYLTQQNRVCEGDAVGDEAIITARGRHVVIIGGGDTGADCLGTVHRQCTSSSCCPARPRRARRATRGRSGPRSSACRRHTRRAANGSTPSPPRGSSATPKDACARSAPSPWNQCRSTGGCSSSRLQARSSS
jgi:glutamate synthase (NADPH/NADH) small chain